MYYFSIQNISSDYGDWLNVSLHTNMNCDCIEDGSMVIASENQEPPVHQHIGDDCQLVIPGICLACCDDDMVGDPDWMLGDF